MSERHPWESPEEDASTEREIFTARLVGVAGPDGRNPVASAIGRWVAACLGRLQSWRGKEAAEKVVGSATETAIGALEGTLKGKSLDGALKEAQILAVYAEARERNAAALKAEAETEKLHQEIARERLEHVIELAQKLGGTVKLATFPDGRIGVMIGDGLVGTISLGQGEPAAPELAAESVIAAREPAHPADEPGPDPDP